MQSSLSDTFEQTCRRYANRVAMLDPTGQPVSFANLFFTVIAFAEALQDNGVRPGDLVSVHVADPIAGNALKLALLRIGATAIGALPRAGHPSGVVADWHLVQADAKTPSPPAENDIVVGRDWIRSPRRPVPVTPGGKLVRSTSGTTGLPKLRLMTDEGLLARAQRGSDWRGQPDGPVFIGYGAGSGPFFNHMVRALLVGVTQLHPFADESAALLAMDRQGVTLALVPPASFRRLLAAVEAGAPCPKSLNRIMVGGGEVSPALAARAEELFGAEVFLSYGSSETGAIAHARPAEMPDLSGRVGRPYPDFDLRFADEAGATVDPATGGELWLRVPEDIRVTEFPTGAPLVDAEGWVATGDLCRLLPDGCLQLIGRRSELLNIGGNKRAPQLFEDLVRGFPGLSEVAAFRLPEPGGGDRLGLATVAGPGFDQGALAAFLSERLGPRYPFQIVPVAAIPVTPTGKTDRKRLAEQTLRAPTNLMSTRILSHEEPI